MMTMKTFNIGPMMARLAVLLCLCLGITSVRAAEVVDLLDPDAKNLGWSFDNGREFPGATGGLNSQTIDGTQMLILDGNFEKGGTYVQMARRLDDIDIDTLGFDLRSNAKAITVRVIDAEGQCHQIKFGVEEADSWQRVTFPLKRFFANRGKPTAVKGVMQYEYWGGPKDGQWHGPAKSIVILAGRQKETPQTQIAVRNVRVFVQDNKADDSAKTSQVREWVPLLDSESRDDWSFHLGQEFPGAKGEMQVMDDPESPERGILKVTADFSEGGLYVGFGRTLQWTGVEDLDKLRFRVRSSQVDRLGLRINDSTGQTHQTKNAIRFEPDGQWHEIELDLAQVTGGETWGGAKDRKWHSPPQSISIALGKLVGEAAPYPHVVEISDVSVRSINTVVQQAPAYTETFEGQDGLPSGWSGQGGAKVSGGDAFEGQRALVLSRTLNEVDNTTKAVGDAFEVSPGPWSIAGSIKSDLVSPDNSFKGSVVLELLSASGQVIEKTSLADRPGKSNWQPLQRVVEVPVGVASARFVASLEKAHGSFSVDNLSASAMAKAEGEENRVQRVLIKHERVGNLLYPGDSPDMTVSVETGPKLPDEAQTIRYVVTDYWGAEQCEPRTAKLGYSGRGENGTREYEAFLDLSGIDYTLGRYYEVHVSVNEPDGRTHDEFTALAYLPEAPAKAYDWQDVPFSSRNWDNRIAEYIRLTDRLGIRLVGIWGGWSNDPPYEMRKPQYDLARELGMAVLISTPSGAIERHSKGYEQITDTVLREGAKAQAAAFGTDGMMAVTMGNEPPDVEGRAEEAVAAYKALYEGYKAANPDIPLVGTSVGLTESYFAAGMGKYLDVYDFHTYNDVTGIRDIFRRYEEMFEKYGQRKPIWSTEMGLNSQGMERRVIASDLVRKLTTFFACGGENASWFGLLYPDTKGTGTGSAGDSHNVFHCKYNQYAPRLDAIAYYNMVNGICVKDFIEERFYGDISATLFRDSDGHCLQVLWGSDEPRDVYVPLEGVYAVQRIMIDGQVWPLNADGQGLTVRLNENPILLMYDQQGGSLPAELGEPTVRVTAAPDGMTKGDASEVLVILGKGAVADELDLVVPPFWSVEGKQVSDAGDGAQQVAFKVRAAKQTRARAGLMHVVLGKGDDRAACLDVVVPLQGATSADLRPTPIGKDGVAGLSLTVTNNSPDVQEITWKVQLLEAHAMTSGLLTLDNPQTPQAYFGEASEGTLTLTAQESQTVTLPIVATDPLTTYRVQARVVDSQGRDLTLDRMMGGFIAAPRTATPIKMDGKLDDPAWDKSAVITLDQADQMFLLKGLGAKPWGGKDDLAADLRLLWDDQYLYLSADIIDDVLAQDNHGEQMWAQDGIQLLIDPSRPYAVKSGKYDYSMGVGTQGPQVWCHLSASPAVPNGEAKDIQYVQHETGKAGNRTVEIAIPWSRLVPFKPGVGANLGMCIVVNEDDQPMRNRYMNWFGDINSKSVEANGDIILTE